MRRGLTRDHVVLQPDDVARIVASAGEFRELSLTESDIEPSVDALFPDGAEWSCLERLHLDECGPLGEIVPRLAHATWTDRLVALSLGGLQDVITGDAAAQLLASPHLGALRRLRLVNVGPGGFAAALATSPVLAHIEELELEFVADVAVVLAAIAGRHTPKLRLLYVQDQDVALDANVLRGLSSEARRPALEQLSLEGIRASTEVRTIIMCDRPGLSLDVDDDET